MDLDSLIPRYLITSSDQSSWKYDQPVIFMGEWCRLHNNGHVWKSLDGIVAEPYGVSHGEKYHNYLYARKLEEELLEEIVIILNRHHNIQWSKRTWRILLGMWLRQYVNMLFNRFHTLENVIKKYNISGVTRFERGAYILATKDTENAALAYSDNDWNLALTSRMLDLKGIDDIKFSQNGKDSL